MGRPWPPLCRRPCNCDDCLLSNDCPLLMVVAAYICQACIVFASNKKKRIPARKLSTCKWLMRIYQSSLSALMLSCKQEFTVCIQQCRNEPQCRHTSAISSAQLCQGIQSVNCLLSFSTWQYWNASESFPGDTHTCARCKHSKYFLTTEPLQPFAPLIFMSIVTEVTN